MRLLALYGKADGRSGPSIVKGYAMVDEADYSRVNRHRWHLGSNGYARRTVGPRSARRVVYLHRELLQVEGGVQVDHLNRDRLDCRRSNLRVVTPQGNSQNTGSRAGSSSRYRGVCLFRRTGRWVASAQVNGRAHHLGYYENEDDAGAAAAAFRAIHMPYSAEARAC